MDQPFTFEIEQNTPCEGMWLFRASFSETMSNHPGQRSQFAPFVEEIVAWCEERFGPSGVTKPWDYSKMGVFYFEDSTFGFEFKMRWC
jgi:hypothetical protein